MNIFEFREYKPFLMHWLQIQPNRGRGLPGKLAEHCRLSPAMLSQILNGEKHLSLEAANDVGGFIGLSDDQLDYFLLLVNFARAGSQSLKARYKQQVLFEQKRNNEILKKMKPDAVLDDASKAIFYSNWIYSGVRNMTACPDFKNVDQIAAHLRLSRASVQRTIDFLLASGLCVLKNGELHVGPQVTHLDNQTSLVGKHHQNWRLQSMNKMLDPNQENLFFTSPMSLSVEAADLIRQKIPTFIEQVRKLVGPSSSEVVRCLNIDWFAY